MANSGDPFGLHRVGLNLLLVSLHLMYGTNLKSSLQLDVLVPLRQLKLLIRDLYAEECERSS
jgi:hypothetical protein